jgi:hypothetical protein
MPLPELRRRLLALRQDVYDSYTYGEGAKVLADPFTTVVPLPLHGEWARSKDLKALERSGALKPDAAFVHNPFSDSWAAIEDAMAEFAVAKYNAVARLCGLLGAKHVGIEELREIEGASQVTWHAKGSALAASGDGTHRTGLGSKISQRIRATWEYDKTTMDIDAARQYLAASGLDGNPMISEMVNNRSERGNLTRQSWTVDLTTEASREIDFALELSTLLPHGPLQGSLDRQKKNDRRQRLEVTIDVSFWPARKA